MFATSLFLDSMKDKQLEYNSDFDVKPKQSSMCPA
jgi:hypothetical protein